MNLYTFTKIANTNKTQCVFGLSLFQAIQSSNGYAIFTDKQLIGYGFEAYFTFRIMHSHLDCIKFGCRNKAGKLMQVLIHNNPYNTAYTSLINTLYVEVLFKRDTTSISYTVPIVQIGYISSNGSKLIIGGDFLNINISDGNDHILKIKYQLFNGEYISVLDTLIVNPIAVDLIKNQWATQYSLGIISAYIDSIQKPIISTLINLGSIIKPDTYNYPVVATNAGKAYVGLYGETDSEYYSSLKILQMNFTSTSQCKVPTIISCANSSNPRKIKIRNIGSSELIVNITSSVECDYKYIIVLGHSEYHHYWDGCEIELEYDEYTTDISIYDDTRSFSLPITSAIHSLFNKMLNQEPLSICTLFDTNEEIIKISYCNCKPCLDLIEMSRAHSLYFQSTCIADYGAACRCYDVSSMSFNETEILLTIPICTQCTYNSQCSWFLPDAQCGGTYSYLLGNPLSPEILNYGFQDRTFDKSRVTDGILRGPQCKCEDARYEYLDINKNKEQYSVYPFEDIIGTVDGCYTCLIDTSKTEFECLSICGNGKIVSALSLPTGLNCASCILNSDSFQILPENTQALIKDCVYSAKNPASECAYITNSDLSPFIGLLSHFLVECPSRKITTAESNDNFGAVCMPYYGYNEITSMLPLLKYVKVDKQWPDEYQCLSYDCKLQTKLNCLANNFDCVCYDTCPLGKVHFVELLKNYQVPCSGRGVCKYTGECLCYNGYLPLNCETHCSETVGGCCINDMQCEAGLSCISKNVEGIGYCK